jgi:hypothetical protein
MIRSTFLRRFVSSLTIFMLVWCQTSAVAQAGLIAKTTPVAEVTATAPCHQAATDSTSSPTQQTDCQSRCQSHNAWFESAKIHLPAVDDLPFSTVSAPAFLPATARATPNYQVPERSAPPPLILVYGRLLI